MKMKVLPEQKQNIILIMVENLLRRWRWSSTLALTGKTPPARNLAMLFSVKLCSFRRYWKYFATVGWANPMPNWKALCQHSTLLLVFWLPFHAFPTDSREWLKTTLYFFCQDNQDFQAKFLRSNPDNFGFLENLPEPNNWDPNFAQC